MPCSGCGVEYAPEDVISPATASAITANCVACVAAHFVGDRGAWRSCVPIYALGHVVQAKLEEAGEWGYASALREALEADEASGEEEEPLTRAALRDALGSLREYAQQFDLADVVEEAVEV